MKKLNLQQYLELMERKSKENREQLENCPYQWLAGDFFSRFHRDTTLKCEPNEIEIADGWRILFDSEAPVVERMAEKLREFLARCMNVELHVERVSKATSTSAAIVFCQREEEKAEGFTLTAESDRLIITASEPSGLRDGAVRLIGLLGFRMAPFFPISSVHYTPRLSVRNVGLGGVANDVFYGSNAVMLGEYDLYALSESEAIPELKSRRQPDLLAELVDKGKSAQEYALKSYIRLHIREKFKENDPIFEAYPDMRGSRTWTADGEFVLCTLHPLFRQYLSETVEGIFHSVPGLAGVMVIIGGEGFYHCYMRPYGVNPGETTCPHCAQHSAEYVVSDLCNLLVESARKVNPEAEIMAWPYSAAWSKDPYQLGFIERLKPGVSVITELEKDNILSKPGGIEKLMWDYSIDQVTPGKRAIAQIASGVPVHALSMAEMSFESALLPMIPVPGRWARRSEAIAGSGAHGIYLWNMAPFHGVMTGELYQYKWFEPVMSDAELLFKLARRTTGDDRAAELLVRAWEEVDHGFDYMPFAQSYYRGPEYLGPAQPILLDDTEEIPEIFYGYYCFVVECTSEAAIEPSPTIVPLSYTATHREGDSAVIETYYRVEESYLQRAVGLLNQIQELIRPEYRTVFEAETFPIRWLYHSVRTAANMFEAGRIVRALEEQSDRKKPEQLLERLEEILRNDLENAHEALPIVEKDKRLDTWHRGDHSFNHLYDMLVEKIVLTEKQITEKMPVWIKKYTSGNK